MTAEQILQDSTASNWLKRQIDECNGRDVVDVLNDLAVLTTLQEERFKQTREELALVLDTGASQASA